MQGSLLPQEQWRVLQPSHTVALPTVQRELPIPFFLAAARSNYWRRQEGNHSIQRDPWVDTEEQENHNVFLLFFFFFFSITSSSHPPKKPFQAPGNRFFSFSCIQNITNCNQVMKHTLLGGDTLQETEGLSHLTTFWAYAKFWEWATMTVLLDCTMLICKTVS